MALLDAMSSVTYSGVIGPGSAPLCETAALLSNANNRPLTSWSCFQHILDNPTLYPTEARTLASITEVTHALSQIMLQFEWQNVVILYSSTSSWLTTAMHIELVLHSRGFNVKHMLHMKHSSTLEKEIHLFSDIKGLL